MEIRSNPAKHQEIEKLTKRNSIGELFSPDEADLPKIANLQDISADAKSQIRQKSFFYKQVV